MIAGALSWQQLTVLADAFKAACSSGSSLLVSEAAQVMLKVCTTAAGLPFPWQASPCLPLKPDLHQFTQLCGVNNQHWDNNG